MPSVLVDTSAWIQFSRTGGDRELRAKVSGFLVSHEAAWCEINRVELWRGAAAQRDREIIEMIEQEAILLPLNSDVWNLACDLARKSRKAGKSVPTTDMIIFACARIHHMDVLAIDEHFQTLKSLY